MVVRFGAGHVVRDALHWVPLFIISLGAHPKEILQLKINNVGRRDGLICLFFGEDFDERSKNQQSRRILPVPQLLLDLGFRECIVQKRRSGEVWAFPEIEPSEADGRRSQILGDRMRTLLGRLKLHFSDEDLYGIRPTLSSKLLRLKVNRDVHQRILGHLEGMTIERHYSDDGLQDVKDMLDLVNYGIRIGRVPKLDFPVITGCTISWRSTRIATASRLAAGASTFVTGGPSAQPDPHRPLDACWAHHPDPRCLPLAEAEPLPGRDHSFLQKFVETT